MGSHALFGSVTRNQTKNLVEFKAGKMSMRGTLVYPDNRKGLVYIYKSEDSLMHFCWKDRTTGTVEDDLIIFPDECQFKKVKNCTTGRVYVLKFKSSTRKLFFWVQESKTTKDNENCKRVNDILNNPPTPGGGSPSEGDLQNMLGNMSEQQLLQLFGNIGGTGSNISQLGGLTALLGNMGQSSARRVTTPILDPGSSPDIARNSLPLQLTDLQSVLSNMSDQSDDELNVDMSLVLMDYIPGILARPSALIALAPHTPPDQELEDVFNSLQFKQALSLFCTAFQSGQLGPVLEQFQLPHAAIMAANNGDLEKFVKALEKSIRKK